MRPSPEDGSQLFIILTSGKKGIEKQSIFISLNGLTDTTHTNLNVWITRTHHTHLNLYSRTVRMEPTARKFLIATHGHFASGIRSSLDIIIGQTENVFLIEAYVNENKGIEDEVETVLSALDKDDELIVLTDLLGGSITNQVVRFTQGRSNVHIVSGFNLALLIEVLMADVSTPVVEVIESAITNAREQVAYVTKLMAASSED